MIHAVILFIIFMESYWMTLMHQLRCANVHHPFIAKLDIRLLKFSFFGMHRDVRHQIKHRIRFIGMCGELFIISVLIGLGFIVFTLFAIGMLDQLNIDAEDWYMINFGLIAMVSAPFVAGFVYDQFFESKLAIASLLSKIFAPLFTILAFLYLFIMLMVGNTPFENREFLILFNAFLILVLAMVSFTIIDQKENESLGITLLKSILHF